MLEQRRAEGNQPLWAAGGAVGEAAKAYLVRLLSIEDVLSGLPLES